MRQPTIEIMGSFAARLRGAPQVPSKFTYCGVGFLSNTLGMRKDERNNRVFTDLAMRGVTGPQRASARCLGNDTQGARDRLQDAGQLGPTKWGPRQRSSVRIDESCAPNSRSRAHA
jgi:hypothetical protein